MGSTPIVCRHISFGLCMLSCSQQSLDCNEPIIGTAAESITRWILIGYAKKWPTRIKVQDLQISSRLKLEIQKGLQVPNTKLLLIRRPKHDNNTVFLVDSGVCYRSTAENCSLVDGAGMNKHLEPLILVCTHGTRDRCCALLGGRFFASMAKKNPNIVWQASHLGGHRFAPVALCLPHGVLYGRLQPEDCEQLISGAVHKQYVLFDKMRGDTRYSRPVQAAIIAALRKGVTGFTVGQATAHRPNFWTVAVQHNQSITFKVHKKLLPTQICTSCVDVAPKDIYGFEVTE